MSSSKFSDMPKELMEYCAQYLENSDLRAFRLVCRQTNAQTKHVVAQRFYTTIKTSLMGSDLRKLEVISMDTDLRKYVKHICIEDDFEQTDPNSRFAYPSRNPTAPPLHIWPRDNRKFVRTDEIGFASLKTMLSEGQFHPETIQIRDYHQSNYSPGPAVSKAFMKDILDELKLAVVSLRLHEQNDRYSSPEATVHLDPQYQGQDIGFSMLHSADICFAENAVSWWSEQLFYNAPTLENLTLTLCDRAVSYPILSSRSPTFKLKKLELMALTVPAHVVLSILANSKVSLVNISFISMGLKRDTSWKELLLRIGSDFPNLSSFTLKLLSTDNYGSSAIKFQNLSKDKVKEEYRSGLEIHERGPKDNRRIPWVCYKGPGAGEVLEVLAACIVSW